MRLPLAFQSLRDASRSKLLTRNLSNRRVRINPLASAQIKKAPLWGAFFICGGERGIRTLDGLLTHTPLAGERLQPLGHLSGTLYSQACNLAAF